MNIILVTGATARARTITLDWRHWAAGGFSLLVVFLVFTFMFNFVTLKWAAAVQHPLLQAFVLADQREEAARVEERVQGHLNAMALRLGELQARVMRLDGLGERLAKTAGLKPQELPSLPTGAAPGRGGAVSSLPSRNLSVQEFSDLVEKLARQVDERSDQMSVLEALLVAGLGQPQVPADQISDRRRLVFVELRLPHRPVHRPAIDARRHRLSRRGPARRSWRPPAARSSSRSGIPSMVK